MSDPVPVVYAIRRRRDGRIYIGATITGFLHRIGQHKSALNGSTHVNRHLQEAWQEEGEDGFEFLVLEEVPDPSHLRTREQYYLDRHFANGAETVFNVCVRAESRLGVVATEETRRKIGIAKRGNKNRYGQSLSEESRRRISESLTGRKASSETRAKLSAIRKGKKHTAEWAAKIGAAHKGKVIPQEMRERIAAALKGGKISEAARENRRLAMLARKSMKLNNPLTV
jgi:group I intron endonuclease